MYRIFGIFILSLCIFHASLTLAIAQTDSYTEYLRTLNAYFSARREFDASKARYNSFKTLQAKETVTNDARKMLGEGRTALTLYTAYISEQFSRIEPVNERVKNLISQDLQTHIGYLQSVENALPETPTFTQINTHSQALATRYGYVRITSTQTILYMDAVRVHDIIRRLKNSLDEMSDINRTLPDNSREKALAQAWLDTAISDTSKDEEEILQFLESIYPQPTVSANSPERRAFEENRMTASQEGLNRINTRVINRLTKARETFAIMVEGYRKL